MADRGNLYPSAYDKKANNRRVENVPDSWIQRWPDRWARELGESTTEAESPADDHKE